ncbi:CHAD domain-containing protein [Chloroflexia bacterium SDU3-3]|nr:CHAD domain-containing protein [Chloroflexia bacterium SDU3-3]
MVARAYAEESLPNDGPSALALALFDLAALDPALRGLLPHVCAFAAGAGGEGAAARAARDAALAAPLPGLTAAQQRVVASAAAFHIARPRPEREPAYAALGKRDRQAALQLGTIAGLAGELRRAGVAVAADAGGRGLALLVAGAQAPQAVASAAPYARRWQQQIGPLELRLAPADLELALPAAAPALAPSPVPALPFGEQPLAEAARASLRRHFEKLLARAQDVRRGDDPEDVHQMRVATRRLRASLQVVAPVFDAALVRDTRRRLRDLAAALGHVRDRDVLLEHLRADRAALATPQQDALQPLIAVVERELALARAALLAYLESKRYRRLVRDFARFLTAPGASVALQAEHGGPLRTRDMAGSLIWRRYEALRSYEPLLPAAPEATLHQMRIAGKRLRYTLEFFTDERGPDTQPCLAPLADLQELLGGLQDAAVARAAIAQLGMAGEPGPAGYLARREAERAALLVRLPATWAGVGAAAYRKRLLALIAAI